MIAIPNMEKPKECIECEFSCLWVNGSTHCMVDGEELFCDGIPQRHDCPLIDIVTCGECKHWDGIECQNDIASTDLEGGAEYALYRDDTDFCSYGERRADE